MVKKIVRPKDKRKFNGKVYELAGTSPTKKRRDLESWAKFQRDVNGNLVRIVETKYGYEAYIHYPRRRSR